MTDRTTASAYVGEGTERRTYDVMEKPAPEPSSSGTTRTSRELDDGRNRRVTGDSLRYNDWYLEAYASVKTHQTMIKDSVRTEAYRNAIDFSRHLIKDKIVMDVGCGTGILSLFAAKAGARRVFAVESSDIADYAHQIMIDNKMDHIVTVIKGKLEDLKSLPDGIEKVDVIISEFMGYSLLYEAMMETVIIARDNWLKPGGSMLPDQCTLYIFGIHDPHVKDERLNWWTDPNRSPRKDDISYAPILKYVRRRPWRYAVAPEKVITEPCKLHEFDLLTMKLEDLVMQKWVFQMKRNPYDRWKGIVAHGVGTYFDVKFGTCYKDVSFSTSPFSPRTHWNQVVFFFVQDVIMLPNTSLFGIFAFRKHPRNSRDVEFSILTKYNGSNQSFAETNIYLAY